MYCTFVTVALPPAPEPPPLPVSVRLFRNWVLLAYKLMPVSIPPLFPAVMTVLKENDAPEIVAVRGVDAPPPLPLRDVLLRNWVLVKTNELSLYNPPPPELVLLMNL